MVSSKQKNARLCWNVKIKIGEHRHGEEKNISALKYKTRSNKKQAKMKDISGSPIPEIPHNHDETSIGHIFKMFQNQINP